ncbi:MAG: tetratricopeptide repeat protein [Alphaproteobacteria bacterium]
MFQQRRTQKQQFRHAGAQFRPAGKLAKSYGAYIAGRVAHLRKDFNKASDYYIQALKIDPDNKELVSRLYLLLASKGRVDEAAYYAQESLKTATTTISFTSFWRFRT